MNKAPAHLAQAAAKRSWVSAYRYRFKRAVKRKLSIAQTRPDRENNRIAFSEPSHIVLL